MSCIKGSHGGGVRSVEDIRRRCRITEDDCWVYAGAARPNPQFWMHALQKPISGGSALCYLLTGKLPQRNVVWRVVCTTPGCLNPEHRKSTKRSVLFAENNRKRDPITKARVASLRRKTSLLTDEQVRQIQDDDRPHKDIAEAFGISRSYVSHVKNGRRRTNPIGIASSVFAWRPAA